MKRMKRKIIVSDPVRLHIVIQSLRRKKTLDAKTCLFGGMKRMKRKIIVSDPVRLQVVIQPLRRKKSLDVKNMFIWGNEDNEADNHCFRSS
jgi:hypothetical protein